MGGNVMPQVYDDPLPAAWSEGAYGAEDELRVAPKASLAAYEWDELKQIAGEIAAASCRAEGLAIARAYRLVDDELRLTGDTKGVVLEDGTTARVRILGFRHDRLAGGTGKAGISFEFANVPVERRMNAGWTNEGGWAKSEMRDWLNSVFFGMLPQDLNSNIAEVEKWTSCRDWDGGWGGAFHVTGTLDKLWLLSMREVYGALSVRGYNMPKYSEVYNAEGLQYQLYVNNDVSVTNYEFCQKRGGFLVVASLAPRLRFRQLPRRLRLRGLGRLQRQLRVGRVPRLLLLAIQNPA